MVRIPRFCRCSLSGVWNAGITETYGRCAPGKYRALSATLSTTDQEQNRLLNEHFSWSRERSRLVGDMIHREQGATWRKARRSVLIHPFLRCVNLTLQPVSHLLQPFTTAFALCPFLAFAVSRFFHHRSWQRYPFFCNRARTVDNFVQRYFRSEECFDATAAAYPG